jgi:lysozyme
VAKKKRIVPKKRKSSGSGWKRNLWISLLILFLCGVGTLGIYVKMKIDEARSEILKAQVRRYIPFGFNSFGIDISHHQGDIDWKELLIENHYDTVIHFVYCKTSEGTNVLDKRWNDNRKQLLKLQYPHGAYHFFRTSDPTLQAAFFLKHWKPSQVDLPPMLDVEYECAENPDLIKDMQTWLDIVEERTGIRPIIYTSLDWYKNKFQNEFRKYKFWVASYSRKPEIIDFDDRIIHWQFSSKGTFPGIRHSVDMNVSKVLIQP